MNGNNRRLYRSRTDVMIGGVCAGVAEYFGVDVTLVRLLWALAALFPPAPGVLAYIIAWIIVPVRPAFSASETRMGEGEIVDERDAIEPGEQRPAVERQEWSREARRKMAGLVLLAIGSLLLTRNLFPWFDLDRFWPVVLIVAGLALVFRNAGSRSSRG
jgi:phage shock protein PspC (stress-responsive transcriptional regulator)